jgi:hypothetical protein
LSRSVFVHVGGKDKRAFLRQAKGDCRADTLRGARHQCSASFTSFQCHRLMLF